MYRRRFEFGAHLIAERISRHSTVQLERDADFLHVQFRGRGRAASRIVAVAGCGRSRA
jgi:hypothetical protein